MSPAHAVSGTSESRRPTFLRPPPPSLEICLSPGPPSSPSNSRPPTHALTKVFSAPPPPSSLSCQVHEAIRADPLHKATSKKKPAEPKNWQPVKLTYDERKDKLKVGAD